MLFIRPDGQIVEANSAVKRLNSAPPLAWPISASHLMLHAGNRRVVYAPNPLYRSWL
jgi:hypothetical protein